ncbi:glycosyltransferase [Salinicola peritrichatus]|uniref:glycosyltransferase n=1 Tax=Salinicola peritrichatus TaxID=1267424 RepID=UPI000DA25CD2|nr:glycosyltransferase [Salinicola peritrichatus]
MQAKGIVGICRFSFLGVSDWSIYREARQEKHFPEELFEEVSKNLYREDRLDLRFRLFENLLLPSILSQTNKNFFFILVTSPEMPKKYIDRLSRIAGSSFNISLVVSKERSLRKVVNYELEKIRDFIGGHPIQFRIDDDDCIYSGYINELWKVAHRMEGIKSFSVTMPKTIVMSAYSDDSIKYYNWFYPFHSAGCAYYSHDENKNIYMFPHQKLNRINTSISLPNVTSAFITKFDGHDAEDRFLANNKNVLKEMDVNRVQGVSDKRFPFLGKVGNLCEKCMIF